MLEKIAIGDAYGMGREFAKPDLLECRPNDGRTYFPHPFHAIAAGRYTDDTQMSLAVAEVLLDKGAEASALDFANAFVRAFGRDPRLGYSSGFHALLCQVENGFDLLARIKPNSIGAGSAMRACPIGWLPDRRDVEAVAEVQARVTHDTVEGVTAAQAAALAAHFAIHELGPRQDLRAWVVDRLGDKARVLQTPHRGQVPNEGLPAVNAALTAIEAGDTLTGILKVSVAFGGDVDTVAAVALGVGSHLLGAEADDLDPSLVENLEHGPWGRACLADLDERLSSTFAPMRGESEPFP
ncbi:ADP-ribosylglycohydrolase family protein [Cereibacter sphaeroides]|uniref:ADP-ribosylglycohydrolase family protein n=1 Tax=Cereibacter sphaeroides TaxID=1063 RepID=UPI001F2D7FAA|nr:ADP-ribosylglycohydrolase family protein [Cereibacter sphaeroides]MCE6958074.1 ADP-ribosylglycohydrolase family protein [Cereibacter sphaeroides]MCE6971315.1 ADP-ribosylglycohydrolase family protein [Cereibacter sphaeroides]